LAVLILVFFAYSYKSTVKHYLPLALPLILTALATIIRGSEERRISLRGFTIDLALGVVSFNVWAINSVLTSQGKTAMLTPARFLDATDTIYCLILALVLVGGCTWMSKEKETLTQTKPVLWIMLGYAVFCFTFPVIIAQGARSEEMLPKSNVKKYVVAVPYKDESLERHIGPAKWGNRVLVHFTEIEAGGVEEAKMRVVESFSNTPPLEPVYNIPKLAVRVDLSRLVAEHKGSK
jgi:hypothetical protein